MSRTSKSNPVKQHVVAASYLAGFTHEDNSLWVTDKQLRRQWPTSPVQAARHTHFYTGDFGEHIDAYRVENVLSRLETDWARILRDIIHYSRLPADDTEDLADLVGFVAFQAMRTPSTREYIGTLVDEYAKMELVRRLDDERNWEAFARHLTDGGESLAITREELLESARRGEFVVSAGKEWTIQTQMRAAILLMLRLAEREWSLFTAAEAANDFVCSDSPVCVTSVDGELIRDRGFCEPRSIVTIPLGLKQASAQAKKYHLRLGWGGARYPGWPAGEAIGSVQVVGSHRVSAFLRSALRVMAIPEHPDSGFIGSSVSISVRWLGGGIQTSRGSNSVDGRSVDAHCE